MSNSSLAGAGTTGKSGSLAAFCGRVTLVHFLSYSLVGALFFALGLNVIVYYESNPDPAMQGYQEIFRATDSVLVVAGPLFNIIRGLLFGLAGCVLPASIRSGVGLKIRVVSSAMSKPILTPGC